MVIFLSSFSKMQAFYRPHLLGCFQEPGKGGRVCQGVHVRVQADVGRWHPWCCLQPDSSPILHFLFPLWDLTAQADHLSCGIELSESPPEWYPNVKQSGASALTFPFLPPARYLLPRLPGAFCVCPIRSRVSCLRIWHPSVTEYNKHLSSPGTSRASLIYPPECYYLIDWTYENKPVLIDREIILQIVGINL